MSEPYSEELADSEAARRLLEFGDDYRNYLDSQSDGASSLSANQISSPVRRRRPTVSYFLVNVIMRSSVVSSLGNILCVSVTSQKTEFFIVTTMKSSDLTMDVVHCECYFNSNFGWSLVPFCES
jgi:hypothetical protein